MKRHNSNIIVYLLSILIVVLLTPKAAFTLEYKYGYYYYGITELSTLEIPSWTPQAINNEGQVVGTYFDQSTNETRYCLWDSNSILDLGYASHFQVSLNNHGQVVGTGGPQGAGPFLWQDGVITYLPDFGYDAGTANHISSNGQIAGSLQVNFDANDVHATIWDNTLNPNELGTFGGHQSIAWAINNNGQVAGGSQLPDGNWRAFLYDDTVGMQNLGILGETGDSCAEDINDLGKVVGYSGEANTSGMGSVRAFLWENGEMTNLGSLGGESYAWAINNSDQVVGLSFFSGGSTPFLWENNKMYVFEDLIAWNSGWILSNLTDINDSGQIIGYGNRGPVLFTPLREPVPQGIPKPSTLVSPSGTINDTTPTYRWNAVRGVTWYYLWVDDSTGNRIQQWYSAEDAGCPSGRGTCSVTPATALAYGPGTWWIQAKNYAGTGPWSSGMSFTVSLSAATLVSPSGPITDTTPTYIWDAVSDATWYQLYVGDSTGKRIQEWYTAEASGCASGTGTCSVTPTTEVIGSCQWYIQTYNSAGLGPWSLPGMSFTTQSPTNRPVAATQISPVGQTTDNTPTYTWNPVSNATWYCLYVNDSSGNKINQWYAALDAGCPDGAGTCSVTPTTEVIGSCQWYIRTYNSAGLGDWSLPGMSFTTQSPTNPPVAATQISPVGETTDNTPTYTWSPVSNATWYCLYVNDSTGNKINQWYAASDAGCPDGAGTCSVTPSVALAPRAGQWWIRTYNKAGYGDWSLPGKNFIILTQSLYDDFSAASISKDKWEQGELVREIRGGELVSKTTAYGSGVTNNLDFKDPASIAYIEADVMIDEIEGDYDPDDTAKYSLPNARLTGYFYNDGTASAPGSHKGEVQGTLRLVLNRGKLKAQWAVERSLDDEATQWETLGSGILPNAISLNIRYKLSIQFEPVLKRFTFKLATLTSTWTSTDTINPSNTPWKAIGTEVSFFPTTPSPYHGKVSASFNNVIAKDQSGAVVVSDYFSSSTLNSTKWASYELVREISGRKLRSKVRSSSATSSPVYNNLEFFYPASIDFIQVNVTPLSYENSQGAQPVARIAGTYYNDGTGTGVPGDHTGDVTAQVWIGGTGTNPAALWMVSRSTDAAGQVLVTLASGTFTTPIGLGNTYGAALGWDGSRLTFRIDNEEATYAPATTINSPNVPWKAIGTRIWDAAGKEATIEALFDDVMTYYGPPSAATLGSPSGTITDTTPIYTWNAVSDATWYRLWVNESTRNKIQKWYTASELGCASGTGSCSVIPTTEVIGTCQWWVQTYNPAGYGPWSAGMSFTVSP
jgi:probable HAF family extracellular repeat protein